MTELEIFSAALNIGTPWVIRKIVFKDDYEGDQSLHIYLGHDRGVKFEYEGSFYPVYDHQPRCWRHLNYFQYKCYLYADVPRVKLATGYVRLVEVPWAEQGSSFTLLFEDMIVKNIQSGMSASSCGRHVGLDSRVIFRINKRRVVDALCMERLEPVKKAGLDETSFKKGHEYLTILTDRDRKKVVGVGFGKDANARNAQC